MGNAMNSIFCPPPLSSSSDHVNDFIWIGPNGELENKKGIPMRFFEWRDKEKQEEAFFTILWSYGHDEDQNKIEEWVSLVRDTMRVNILTYDYPGYGLHEGAPSERGVYDSIFAAYLYLTEQRKISPNKIVLFGKTLGSGAAINLLATLQGKQKTGRLNFLKPRSESVRTPETFEDIAGLILQSPICSILSLLPEKTPLITDMFENSKKIGKIKSPVLIFCGKNDEIVPVSHSLKLTKKSQNLYKLVTLDNASSLNYEQDCSDDILDEGIDFLNFIVPNSLPGIGNKLLAPESITNSPANVITKFLHKINMGSYVNLLLEGGIFTYQDLQSLNDTELLSMGITDETHRKAILTAAKHLSEDNENTHTNTNSSTPISKSQSSISPFVISKSNSDLADEKKLKYGTSPRKQKFKLAAKQFSKKIVKSFRSKESVKDHNGEELDFTLHGSEDLIKHLGTDKITATLSAQSDDETHILNEFRSKLKSPEEILKIEQEERKILEDSILGGFVEEAGLAAQKLAIISQKRRENKQNSKESINSESSDPEPHDPYSKFLQNDRPERKKIVKTLSFSLIAIPENVERIDEKDEDSISSKEEKKKKKKKKQTREKKKRKMMNLKHLTKQLVLIKRIALIKTLITNPLTIITYPNPLVMIQI